MDILSYTLGKKAGGGTPTVLEEKNVTVTSNGETEITPSTGYNGISKVNLTTNVPSQKFSFINGGGFSFFGSTQTTEQLQNEVNNIITNTDTSKVIVMNNMFQNCINITSLDLRGFDTSNVTTMNNCFAGCSSLNSINVSNLNTSNVNSIASLFFNSSNITSIDLSTWNTDNIETINYFVYGCSNLRFLDVRTMDFVSIMNLGKTNYQTIFGNTSIQSSLIPANCEIIVKDITQKNWFRNHTYAGINRLTNVKTVAEYEGS